MFCPHCGAESRENAKFCENCGKPFGSTGQPSIRPGKKQHPAEPKAYSTSGFSRRIDSAPVQKALKKQRRITRITWIIFILAPVIGFVIYGAVSDQMDIGKAFVYGLIISLIFAIINLISFIGQKMKRPFQGTVAKKKLVERMRSSRSSGDKSRRKYLIWFDCDNGKRKKKEVSFYVYDYLDIGDQVRYLPQFPQPYEKYDKSEDGMVMCMFCGRKQDLHLDTCKFCHSPLIK